MAGVNDTVHDASVEHPGLPEPVWCAGSEGWAGQQLPHTSSAQAMFGSSPPRTDAQTIRIAVYRRIKTAFRVVDPFLPILPQDGLSVVCRLLAWLDLY